MRRLLTGKNKCLGNCKDKKGKRRRSKKKKREKEVCANFVPQIVKVTTFR